MKADGFARPMPFGQPFGTGEVEGIADNDDLFGIVQQGRAEGDVFVSAFGTRFDADFIRRHAHGYGHIAHGFGLVAAVAVGAATHQQPADQALPV